MIRENALKLLRDEIPHGIGIGIDKIKLREDGIHDVLQQFIASAKHTKAS